MKTNNKEMRLAFRWIDSIYTEGQKLFEHSAEHLRYKFVTTKEVFSGADTKTTFILDYIKNASQFFMPKKASNIVAVIGISFYEEKGEEWPRLILSRIQLQEKLNPKNNLKNQLSDLGLWNTKICSDGFLYYIVERDNDKLKWIEKGRDDYFLETKPISNDLKLSKIISTWVPLSSIDKPKALIELLESAEPFFLKDNKKNRNNLRNMVQKLRGKEK